MRPMSTGASPSSSFRIIEKTWVTSCIKWRRVHRTGNQTKGTYEMRWLWHPLRHKHSMIYADKWIDDVDNPPFPDKGDHKWLGYLLTAGMHFKSHTTLKESSQDSCHIECLISEHYVALNIQTKTTIGGTTKSWHWECPFGLKSHMKTTFQIQWTFFKLYDWKIMTLNTRDYIYRFSGPPQSSSLPLSSYLQVEVVARGSGV